MSEDEPEQPPDLLAYVLSELVEIQTSMVSLKATVEAQRQTINTLFITLPVSKRADALALLQAQQQCLETEDAASALMLRGAIGQIQALLGTDGNASLNEAAITLGLDAALVQSVAPKYAQPMRSWLAIATPEEIVQEMLELPPEKLDALLRSYASSKPTRRGDGQKQKRKGDN